MPVISRQQLRQRLGLDLLRDIYLGVNTASVGPGGASAYFLDTNLANAAFSGRPQYQDSWAYQNGQTYRNSSFNFPSGAYLTMQVSASGIYSGSAWEIHELVSPDDKHRAIDWAVERIWIRQEVAIASVDGQTFYSVGYDFGQVFDWWINSNPTGSTTRDKLVFEGRRPEIRLTASGRELRLSAGLQGSQQIVLDAEVRASLGAADTATINVPDIQTILYGAESQCWEMLAKRAPMQDRRAYLANAQRAAAAYSRKNQRFTAQKDVAPRFRNPVPF